MAGRVWVRELDRSKASPRPGMASAWTEFQVKHGNVVVSRHDTPWQAEKAADRLRDDLTAVNLRFALSDQDAAR